MKNKNLFLVIILLLAFYTITTFGMHTEQVLAQTMEQLANALDEVQRKLQKATKYEEVEKGVQKTLEHIDASYFDQLDPELKQLVLLELIPTSITTPEQFIAIVQHITNLAKTNKANYALLSDARMMRLIIQKLFAASSEKTLRNAFHKIKKDKIQILPIIGNVLLFSQEHPDRVTDQKELGIEQTIRALVEANLNPNFFIGENNLLHRAIYWNMPELVAFLIQNGADINMPNKKEPATINKKLFEKKELPFIIAFIHSPQSALILLQQKNIDLKIIFEKISSARLVPLLMNQQIAIQLEQVLIQLLEKRLDPNITILYGASGDIPLLSFAIVLLDILNNNDLTLIESLLSKRADYNRSYWDTQSNKNTTPLQFAEQLKDSHPELYDLMMKYKKRT